MEKLWNNIKRSDIYATKTPERENSIEEILEALTAKNLKKFTVT